MKQAVLPRIDRKRLENPQLRICPSDAGFFFFRSGSAGRLPFARCCEDCTKRTDEGERRLIALTNNRKFLRAAMLDLRQFLLRVQVLRLYRSAVRSVRRAPPSARGELQRTIREEVERNRHVKDPQHIRFLLSEGSQRLKELNSMLGIQGHD